MPHFSSESFWPKIFLCIWLQGSEFSQAFLAAFLYLPEQLAGADGVTCNEECSCGCLAPTQKAPKE